MSTIKNLDKLSGLFEEDILQKLDAAAAVHLKQSNIEFTVVRMDDKSVVVDTEQGKTSGNYANFKTLIKRTREVFDKFLPSGYELLVNPREFAEFAATTVTPAWIDRQMLEKEVRIKQIAFDTGLDRKDISGWVTGERNMSQIVKAMFYYYFKSLN
ncbi:XRE family transcriptional regulator [Paradesertivirga mongoliensis]|uniref:XRE family transcriptional regulator n=1 Tax=Paradesertivirga mongoliensis TaxID=2100740 RepID=A0ABW4ZPU5_9SPHI|nr:XRE family transcriptional regulator [Pedobacter mongoliensis]